MGVINPYSSAVAAAFAENAVASRQDKRVMRESDLARQLNDIEQRMTMEQMASSQRQAQSTVSIAQSAAGAVQKGVQAGQKIADAPEHIRINSDLNTGASQYQEDQGAALLATDLGNDQTVEDVLGTDSSGQPIADPDQRQAVAQRKLDTLMTGNFDSEEQLIAQDFSKAEAEHLMKLKDRGEGSVLSTDEAVEFLFGRSSVVQKDKARDEVHDVAESLIKHVAFQIPSQGASIGLSTAEEGARSAEEDRGRAARDRGTQRKVGLIINDQLAQAGQMVLNKRSESYEA